VTPTAPSGEAYPAGVPVAYDSGVRRLEGGQVLLGGDPGRLVRLRPAAAAALASLGTGVPVAPAVLALARTLVDGGLLHPRPVPSDAGDVTVVVPVRDRAKDLDRCLSALGTGGPVVVVDDGSLHPAAVADVCHRHCARLVVRSASGGPAAARNEGLLTVATDLVAFVDSDCVPPPGWLGELAGHFADPQVGAVAPRVRGSAGGSLLSRYSCERGPLDLGPHKSAVRPGGRVPYVPTAALLVRMQALAPGPFDAALRYGEDVDLVWRLADAGWRIRYDPRTVVAHREPDRWPAWLTRRHRYGTSAAPLAARHGTRLAPLVVAPLPGLAWLLLVAGRPLPALAVAAVPAARLQARLRRAGLRPATSAREAVVAVARGVVSTGNGLGGAGSVLTAPLLLGLLAGRRARRAAATALVAPPLLDWAARRPPIDPVRWCGLRVADDLAYASGVWRGCWTSRSLAALRPRTSRPR